MTADEQDRVVADAILKAVSASGGSPAVIGGASRIALAMMLRPQLERIADAVELGLLDSLYASTDGSSNQPEIIEDRERIVGARDFLRDKVIARIEREKASAEMRPADQRGMCPGGCGRKAIDGKRTCGEASCGRTTP